MQRFHQLLFASCLIALCWLGMMAVHELGHIVGAVATGGKVVRVVLHPLTISRTDVAPNPRPGVVVWMGPIVGCVVPLAMLMLVPRRWTVWWNIARFFAGFCLIANGAYIGLGSFAQVGDCGEMLRTGTPLWVMMAFGVATAPAGFYLWHRLGSLKDFLARAELVTPGMAYATAGVLVVAVAAGVLFSPR